MMISSLPSLLIIKARTYILRATTTIINTVILTQTEMMVGYWEALLIASEAFCTQTMLYDQISRMGDNVVVVAQS
jgi:chromosome condensin MukBEF MukE localization factor